MNFRVPQKILGVEKGPSSFILGDLISGKGEMYCYVYMRERARERERREHDHKKSKTVLFFSFIFYQLPSARPAVFHYHCPRPENGAEQEP